LVKESYKQKPQLRGFKGYSMNLDYLEITKFLNKDKLCFDYLKKNAIYDGAERYYFDRCNKIEVWYMEASNQVRIKGSIPYFINGHNFYSSQKDWLEGLEYIQGCLQINIFTGQVNCLEYGTIQEIPFPESDFLRNHIKSPGMQTKPYLKGNVLTGKEFDSSIMKIKLYDVSRNIKNKLDKPIREELSRLHGWDKEKHYIKVENHYKKPEICFRSNIYLNELLSYSFQHNLKNELLTSYMKIMKTGNAILPSHKADINAGTIPLLILKELESVYNFNTEDLIKNMLKTIPDGIFSSEDRKARLRTIRDNLKKISIQGQSKYDIRELLQARIEESEINGKAIPELKASASSSFICN
jgi:hypothetical protein